MLCLFLAASADTPTADRRGFITPPFVVETPFGRVPTGACLTMRTTDSFLMKIPYPGAQVKYLFPCTEPSFFPVSSGNSRPSQCPAAMSSGPEYRTTPCLPSLDSTVCPIFMSMGAASVGVAWVYRFAHDTRWTVGSNR